GLAADSERNRANQRTWLQSLWGARSVFHHLAAELVAEYHVAVRVHHPAPTGAAGDIDELPRVLGDVQIGATDAATDRLHDDLSGGLNGVGDRVNHQLTLAENSGTHHNLRSASRIICARPERIMHRSDPTRIELRLTEAGTGVVSGSMTYFAP